MLTIQSLQMERDLAILVALSKGPVVLLILAQTIEYELSTKDHHYWGLPNISLLAFILINI